LLALFAPRLPQPTHRPNQRAADLEGFLEKNKDKLYDHLKEMMAGCGNPFASALFVQGGSGKKKKGVQTIATKFKSQLKELVDTLEATMPHYVRCVKPNDKKLKFNEGIDACEAAKMRRQLLYAGVMETIAIRKLGYPVREPYPDFWERCCKMRWCVCAVRRRFFYVPLHFTRIMLTI
jgi:myosin heavy subunit